MAINLTYVSQENVLNQGLATLFNSSILKDTVLACSDGQCLKAHRLIFATFSPYFKKLLSVCKEPMPTILLPDVKISVMEILLEFMYTGNIRAKKELLAELVLVNKLIGIKGLDDLLSKHDGFNQPPKKKQRIESASQFLDKPSSLFRPWDSPVQAPKLDYPVPWIPLMFGSPMLPFPMSPTMNFPKQPSFSNTNGIAPAVPNPLSWTMPLGYPFLPESTASTHIPTSLPHHIETTLSATAPLLQSTVPYPDTYVEKIHNTTDSEYTQKTIKRKITNREKWTKPEGKYIVPGKERCNICKRDFFNLLGHQKAAHGLLKKPIQCCGREFTTRQDLRGHKKSECDFRNSW